MKRSHIVFVAGVIIFAAAAIALMGCERDIDGFTKQQRQVNDQAYIDKVKANERAYEKSIDNCLDRGGIIIRSSWDGRIVDCR